MWNNVPAALPDKENRKKIRVVYNKLLSSLRFLKILYFNSVSNLFLRSAFFYSFSSSRPGSRLSKKWQEYVHN